MGEEKEETRRQGESEGDTEEIEENTEEDRGEGQQDQSGDKGGWYTFKCIITRIGRPIYQSTVIVVCAVPKISKTVVIITRKATTTIGNEILAAVGYDAGMEYRTLFTSFGRGLRKHLMCHSGHL